MNNKIEKMVRMRRNTMLIAWTGTVVISIHWIYTGIFLPVTRSSNDQIWRRSLHLWLLCLFFFVVRFLLYKRKLMKDPSLSSAVNDERVRMTWLKAYRFSLIIVIGITIFWKIQETGLIGAWTLPDGPWLIVFGAIIALTGSFLFYNRGEKDG